MKTLVVGLGNPLLTDDGIGVKVAYEVARIVSTPSRDDVEVIEASVGGLRLMELMIGYDRVLLVDAITTKNGAKPGTIHRITYEDLRDICPTQHSASAHDTTLVNALEFGRTIGLELPSSISVIAIEADNLYEFGCDPTPAVAAAIPEAVAAVLAELGLN